MILNRTTGFPSRSHILDNPHCFEYISQALINYLIALGVQPDKVSKLGEKILNLAKMETNDDIYEKKVHQMFKQNCTFEAEQTALQHRSERIFQQLSSYLLKGSTLDYGCGDGKVATLIHNFQKNVSLADTYHHHQIKDSGLPFFYFSKAVKRFYRQINLIM